MHPRICRLAVLPFVACSPLRAVAIVASVRTAKIARAILVGFGLSAANRAHKIIATTVIEIVVTSSERGPSLTSGGGRYLTMLGYCHCRRRDAQLGVGVGRYGAGGMVYTVRGGWYGAWQDTYSLSANR